ncbi:hypothetical protein LEN26_016229 [Aphanomyces euteiches]|nr:hypothetical protein LEN26_016229 [Aphanomyces euteiches]KAH9115798.1 hypothetical protein AeMF1_010177 [Aphanomyces euteiches]KAH9194092.1 hypothetical protein AeNC1_003943 [Aphanomyces euteiches]
MTRRVHVEAMTPALEPSNHRVLVLGSVVAVFSAFLLLVCAEVAVEANDRGVVPSVAPIVNDMKTMARTIMLSVTPLTNVCILASKSTVKTDTRSVKTFQAYQAAGWLCFAAVLFMLATCDSEPQGFAMPCSAHEISLAYFGLMAQVFAVSSLLAVQPVKSRLFVHNYMNLLVVVGALFLALSAEWISSNVGFSTNASIGSLMLCIAAVISTYGLGGQLVHKSREWKFWQPFSGGIAFICVQFVAWTCFTGSLLLQLCFLISFFVVEIELFVGIMGTAGLLCIASQLGMIVSLLVYMPQANEKQQTPCLGFLQRLIDMLLPTLMVNLPPLSFVPYILPWLLVDSFTWTDVTLYTVAHIAHQTLLAVICSQMLQVYFEKTSRGASSPLIFWLVPVVVMAMPAVSLLVHAVTNHEATIGCVAFSIPWYFYTVSTMVGLPAQTGCRFNRELLAKPSRFMEAFARYFSFQLIRTVPLDPKETYIFAYHPHGIMPGTVMWMQFTQQWHSLFPGIFAFPLSASIVHYFPGIRDAIQYLGAREVTRTTFSHALRAGESIFVVPGGQAELVESQPRVNQVRVYTGHKGFLRLALEHGTPVVPVLSYRESDILENIRFPAMQRWFIKRFALPCPHYPHGWLGLPIPHRVPVPVVVGEPLRVTQVEHPTKEQVDALHAMYYESLKALFHQHKDAVRCSDFQLVFIDK